jgi:hypothetical protein
VSARTFREIERDLQQLETDLSMLPGAVFARSCLESRVKDLMERLALDLGSDDDRFLLAFWRDNQYGAAAKLRELLKH